MSFDSIKAAVDFEANGNYAGKQNSKPTLVLVYQDMCGHCVQFKPTYAAAAVALKDAANFTRLQFPTTAALRKIADNAPWAIRGVPTIIGFDKHGKFVSVFNGDRTVNGLAAFIKTLSKDMSGMSRPMYHSSVAKTSRPASITRTRVPMITRSQLKSF